MIYFGTTVTVQIPGQAWRGETCEHCGQQFYYKVASTGMGVAINPYLLDSYGSGQRAEEMARVTLDHALRHAVVPVPCPHCILYQAKMVPLIRAQQFLWMAPAARFLLFTAATTLFFGGVLTGLIREKDLPAYFPAIAAVMFGLSTLSLLVGIGLLLSLRRKRARYDPNAKDLAETRQRLATTALKPEEFAMLRIPPTPATPALLGSHPRPHAQLVGQNCVRCAGRIPHELDSRFCRGCGSPVHDRCAVPAPSGGCPVCGAGASAA